MGASPSKPRPASPEARELAVVAPAVAGGGGVSDSGDDNVGGGRRSKRSSRRNATRRQQQQQEEKEEEEDQPLEQMKNQKKKHPLPPVPTLTRSTQKSTSDTTSTTTTKNDGQDDGDDEEDSFTFRGERNRKKEKNVLKSKAIFDEKEEEEDASAEEVESEEELEWKEEVKNVQQTEGRISSTRSRSLAATIDGKNDDDNKSISSSSTTISEASMSPTLSISKVDDFVKGSEYQVKDRVYATKGWYWSWGYVVGIQQVAGSSDPPIFTYDIEMLDDKRVLKDVEECNLMSLDMAMVCMNELSQLPRDWPPVHFLCAHHGHVESIEEKEEKFRRGTKVYAEFNRAGLFWATIAKVIPSKSLNGRTQYRLNFDDGDQSLQDCSMIHSLEEALRLMKNGQYELDKPPKHWNIALDDFLNPEKFNRERQSEKKKMARSTTNRSNVVASKTSLETSNTMLRTKQRSKVQGSRSAPRPNELMQKRQQPKVAAARSTISTKDLKRKPPPSVGRQPAAQTKKRPKISLKHNEVIQGHIGIESTEEKEEYFDCGQIVYAEFPDNKQWYWGVISQKFPPDDSRGRRMEFLVVFCDGDRATLDCSRMTGYEETKHMMDNGFVFKNYPDPKWLEKQQLSSKKFSERIHRT